MHAKKLLPVVALLFGSCLVVVTFAAVGRQISEKNPIHPDQCYRPREKLSIPVGKTVPWPNACGKLTCSRDPSDPDVLLIEMETCGSFAPPSPGCKPDPTKPYPGCCVPDVCPKWVVHLLLLHRRYSYHRCTSYLSHLFCSFPTDMPPALFPPYNLIQ